jgi:UDP-4-amino-4,6-dideoxy-N-acetyl-beta-L-altrosamine transaminase
MKFLPYGHQQVTSDDIDAVIKTLKSDYLTQGSAVVDFEKDFCRLTGAAHAIACSSGTAALHLAMLASEVKENDRVIVPSVTFAASANCARFNNAEVLFADVDDQNFTMSPASCEKLLQKSREENRPVKAIVTVDLAGHPCAMEAFAQLKEEYGFIWIEDACHSLGAEWTDKKGMTYKTGQSLLPDLSVFSFHPVKHVTTGEGGMVTTPSSVVAETLRSFRSHGITKNSDDFINQKLAYDEKGNLNPWYYEMQRLGYNYRITDIQAALGSSQLKRLPEFIEKRTKIVDFYRSQFSENKFIEFPAVASGVRHAWHLAVILIDFVKLGKTRAEVMNELKARGIGTQVHYIPVPLLPYYASITRECELENSLSYYQKALSLPCYPDLTDEDLKRISDSIKEIIK